MTEVIETVWIEMPDGAKLAARLWLPDGARENPVPCILEYIPYRRRDRTRPRDESMHPHFVEAGYAAIRVDQRGAGDSDGLMLDEYAEIETQDGVDVIAWIASQSWCDGNVGMFGKSWGAYNSFQVAARRPPALKAIAPVMGTDDRWREDIHFYGGQLAGDNFWWGSIMHLYNAFPPDPEIVGAEHWQTLWRARLEGQTFWPAMWLEHQTHDEMWRRGSVCENYADIDIPVYFFGGWADLFRDTPFRIAEHLSAPLKVMMGPWAHLYPHEGKPGPQVDFVAEVIRFWDHCLKGRDTGLMDEPPLRFYLQDSLPHQTAPAERPGRWVEEAAWPSPGVTETTLWMNEGTLAATAETGAEQTICSPQTFGSAGGDMCSFGIAGDLPSDQRVDAGGALSFTSAPLEEALDLLGQPEIDLEVSIDRAQGFLAGLLIDEAPDGTQTLITRGFANLMHRNSDTAPEPVTPGEKMNIRLPLHGIGCRVAAGHKVVVQIATAYWPILWPAPAPVTASLVAGRSCLRLPVRGVVADEQPSRTLPQVPSSRHAPKARQAGGTLERTITRDAVSGLQTERVFIKGGVFGPNGGTVLETGTKMTDMSERVYAVHPDDPLQARATMRQTSTFQRDDWDVRIETSSEQTATETEFRLAARLKAWSGDELFFEEEKTYAIPRNGM